MLPLQGLRSQVTTSDSPYENSSGPNIIVAIVATPQGRWHDELTKDNNSAKRAMDFMVKAVAASQCMIPEDINIAQFVVGIGVLHSWKVCNHSKDSEREPLRACIRVADLVTF